jgi:hypothetical protein
MRLLIPIIRIMHVYPRVWITYIRGSRLRAFGYGHIYLGTDEYIRTTT